MKKKYSFKNAGLTSRTKHLFLAVGIVVSHLCWSQQTFTFTTAGGSGASGPTQLQANTAYAATNLAGSVTVNAGIQSFTIPNTGTYLIDITGASGGSTNATYNKYGGLGARMAGEFFLNTGDVLTILVGQQGVNGCGTGGGGGGTYVVLNGNQLLIAAGGGGGAASDNHGADAVTSTSGTNDNPGGVTPGGTNGGGGSACNSIGSGSGANHGGGGGGYLGNGATSTAPSPGGGGLSFSNGGTGGTGAAPGGFGGGGGGTSCTVGGGGGGGYSGGAGGQQVNYCQTGLNRTGGGGGGSYNAATNQTNTAGANYGNGYVILKELCDIQIFTSASNTTTPFICAGQSLTLTTNAISNYTWSTGNTTNTNIVVSPISNTTYSIYGTTAMGCNASAFINVIVSGSAPTLTISGPQQVCLGQTAALTASGAVTYSWTGGISNGVTFTPNVTSTYTVHGENGCGITTDTRTLTVAPLSVTTTANPATLCYGQSSQLSITVAANSFTWSPGLSGPLVTASPSIIVSPTASTVYTVVASDGTCSGVGTFSLAVNPLPTVTSSASDNTVCPGGSITLSASGGLSHTWSPGGTVANSIVVNPTVSILYSVVGDNSFGCTAGSSQVILVQPQPTLNITSNQPLICEGNSATLTVTGANIYAWDGGPTGNIYVVTPNQTTSFSVTGTFTNNGCSSTKSYTVGVYSPFLSVSSDTAICEGGSVGLSASGTGATSYTWNPNNIPLQNITVFPTSTTVYTVSAKSFSGTLMCPVSETVLVTVNLNPSITAVASKSIVCRNQPSVLTATGATTFTWSTVSNSQAGTGTTFTASANTPQTLNYTVTGTDENGCVGNTQIKVTVSGCVGIAENQAPEANFTISPNPNNGNFVLRSNTEAKLRLINELGQLVKEIELSAENGYQAEVKDLAKGFYFVSGSNGAMVKIVVSD